MINYLEHRDSHLPLTLCSVVPSPDLRFLMDYIYPRPRAQVVVGNRKTRRLIVIVSNMRKKSAKNKESSEGRR